MIAVVPPLINVECLELKQILGCTLLFKLVLVCSKKASVSGEEIDKVKGFLSNQKMSKKAEKFFKDLKSKAYINILLNE